MSKVTVHIEERILSARTWKEYTVTRVLRPLGSTDYFVQFKGSIVPVSKRGEHWVGVSYA